MLTVLHTAEEESSNALNKALLTKSRESYGRCSKLRSTRDFNVTPAMCLTEMFKCFEARIYPR